MTISRAKQNVNQLNEFSAWDIFSSQTVLDKLKEEVSVKDFGAVGDGVADDTVAIQNAINYFGTAESTAQGVVYLPRGTYKITDALVLPFEVSVRGASGRASRIYQYGVGKDIFTWSQTIPSFSRQVSITDLWLKGPGVTNGGTPSAININHPWGIDSLTLKRLWIEEFNGWGIRTNQPASGISKNCFQFSDWDSIYIRNCNVGMVLGYGFTGESSFSNICSQFCTTSCLDFTINPASTGPQGINLVNFSGGWSPYGVRFTAGTAGNIKFDMFHMEQCTAAAVLFDSASVQKVVFDTPWIAKCVSGILGNAGGQIDIVNPQFQGAGNVTDTFIKLTASSNFAINVSGSPIIQAPATGSAPTDHISVIDMASVSGAVQRKSSTKGTFNAFFSKRAFLQVRGLMGETATVAPQNLLGTIAIANAATSVSITFTRAEADTAYQIYANINGGTITTPVYAPGIMIGNKTVNGFTAYFSSAAPAGGFSLDWLMVR